MGEERNRGQKVYRKCALIPLYKIPPKSITSIKTGYKIYKV